MPRAIKAKDQSSGWPAIRHIRQTDAHGCVMACLAMISGRSYEDVKRELEKHSWCPDCGTSDATIAAFLSEHGFAFARLLPELLDGTSRTVWPPEPFADVHIIGVKATPHCRALHAAVWLRDGRVFDPEYKAPMTLAHYEKITDVIGVYRAPECHPRP